MPVMKSGAAPQPFPGGPTIGPLHSDVAGRTDHLPINVPDGSHVLPADVVSGLGEGNTFAGTKVLDNMFKKGPYGAPLPKIGGGKGRKRGTKMPPGKPRFGIGKPMSSKPNFGFAEGGAPESFEDFQESTSKPGVPIMAAGGEYVIPPEVVEMLGEGDPAHGHAVLDAFILKVRNDTIKELKKLPGPAKD